MNKFLLGLSAVVAVFLPLSQNAQAHWVIYRKVYVTITFTCIIAPGILAFGMPGPGTRVAGSNRPEETI